MRRIIIVLLFFLWINKLPAQFGFWEILGDMPKPVAGANDWVNNEYIYLLGGYSDSTQSYTDWIQEYNVNTNVWNNYFMKEKRYGFVSDRYGNDILFFGGVHEIEANSYSLDSWRALGTDELVFENENFSRIFATGVIHNDHFYIFGGNPLPESSVDSLPYIVEYSLIDSMVTFKMDSFYTEAGLPEQQMCTLVGDDIYIFGGVINGVSQRIYKFNTIDHTFRRLPVDLLTPRAAGHAIVGTDPNKIIIIGGYNESNTALATIEFLTISDTNYTIEYGPSLNIARSHFTASYVEGWIFAMGGYGENGLLVKEIESYNDTDYATTNTDEKSLAPAGFKLYQNYPNPFNPSTSIKYTIAPQNLEKGTKNNFQTNVRLKIYDALGNDIVTLVDQYQSPGTYQVTFNTTAFTQQIASGIYFYSLQTDDFIQNKKMLLLK